MWRVIAFARPPPGEPMASHRDDDLPHGLARLQVRERLGERVEPEGPWVDERLDAALLEEEGFEGEWVPGVEGEWLMEQGVPADGWQPLLGEPCCQ